MIVLQRGHRYKLAHRDGRSSTVVQFVNKEPGQECEGVTAQEVLRMLLDRNRYCTACLPNAVSERIQYHLRMALVLHEMRALERKVQKGELAPEHVLCGDDGHWVLLQQAVFEAEATLKLAEYTEEWERQPKHHSANGKD